MRTYRCPCCGSEFREDQLEEVNSSRFVSSEPPKGIKMSSVIDCAECVHIAEIHSRQWIAIAFLTFWLSGWTFGMVMMVNKFFFSGPIKLEALFSISFLLAEVVVASILLHMLFGGRRIEVGRTKVKSSFFIVGPVGRTKVFSRESGDSFCVQQSEVYANGRPAWNLVLKSRTGDKKLLWAIKREPVDYLAAYFNRV